MARDWNEELRKSLLKQYGPKKGAQLNKKYSGAFPTSYLEDCTVKVAMLDIRYMEQLSPQNPLVIDFYLLPGQTDRPLHLKIFQHGNPIPLSDILPMLENMDLRTFSERPYHVSFEKNSDVWISDFSVMHVKNMILDIEKVKPLFEDAFRYMLMNQCENDGFNRLVLGAQLSWRDISILRAYVKYVLQTGFRFSQAYIEKTFAAHPNIASDLVTLFKLRHQPRLKASAKKQIVEIEERIQKTLDAVTNLDEDRMMRRILAVINATLRTNFFQTTPEGSCKEYLSFKLKSGEVPELPLPHPLYEIFVYAPRFEGIHLRCAKVARGGIRWSDRREDFRTEILGLMKAQKVKNALIVPSGAKGGFVLKMLPLNPTREMVQAEVIHCYKSFIRGLLDLTDNLVDKKVVRPVNVVCYDDEDTYLVVAADKGTASFSDIANGISKEYDFWLGDAFASGGSAGYDHKKMGITARGAWESIKRHFLELGHSIAESDFTMIGIGDMSGDVFGNGALYTPHIKLVAAFDHRHIFLDPSPHPQKTYDERLRLFNLPSSSWADFNAKLISKGGGVFARTLKSIPLSAEMRKVLDVQETEMTPQELIRAILKAPVDLLFNGGIGTYVKATTETHADVGDKSNEFCRINGNELRCRIVGEGGNLGFTQLGRIEYALQGGLINTDFIDNSAGVDCSDHEVNIKILLNSEVKKGNLTEAARNKFLAKMTHDVAKLVLKDNYNQALTMSTSAQHASKYITLYQNYLKALEASGTIDRAVEFLPDEKKITERKAAGQGFTRPELAVLLAYTKIYVKNELLKTDVLDNPYFFKAMETAFPAPIEEKYQQALAHHSLRREIIATQLSNHLVDVMGITFVFRIQNETGASVSEIISAYSVASHIYESLHTQRLIESLSSRIPLAMQYEMMHHVRRLQHLSTRWFLRCNRMKGDIEKLIVHYAVPIKKLEKIVPNLMAGMTKTYLEKLTEQFMRDGLEKEVALRVATSRAMYTSLNIIEVATQNKFDLIKTALIYFEVGGEFNLVWYRDQIANDTREGHWDNLARLGLRDELDTLQRLLTIVIIQSNKRETDHIKLIERWKANHAHLMARWGSVQDMLHSSTSVDYVMFFIALRELIDLVRAAQV